MPIKIKPLTKKELVEYFQVYREAFPDWSVEHAVVLTRVALPLKQHIGFEALRSGGYRPSCWVSITLQAPEPCHVLFQLLDVKYHAIYPREHARKWPAVVAAMEEQFTPRIREPLDIEEVLHLSEEQAEPHRVNMAGARIQAVLNAYLGRSDRALFWCDHADEQAATMGRPLADWEVQTRAFVAELRQAIHKGRARDLLAV